MKKTVHQVFWRWLFGALMLFIAPISTQAQTAAASVVPVAREASGPQKAAPTASAVSAVAVRPDVAALDVKLDRLAIAVAAAASAAEARADDPWQDAKSVMLNVLSNRIDSWLFDRGAAHPGFVAWLIALLALAIAVLRFFTALALARSGDAGGWWERFKATLHNHGFFKWMRVLIAAFAVVYTGLALYVVVSARSSQELPAQALSALRDSLQSCQVQLAQAARPADPSPAASGVLAPELMRAVERQGQACSTAIRDTVASLDRIETTARTIESGQPGFLSRLLTFAAWIAALFALGAITKKLGLW